MPKTPLTKTPLTRLLPLTAWLLIAAAPPPVMAESPAQNSAKAAAFFKENAARQGVATTASGLQYQVLAKGAGGKSPTASDLVTVHYRGTTLDGKEFDSSHSRGEPATFPLNAVIAGWTEGVQLMREGDKFRLFIPAHLAYGERGAGGVIGPNEALIFDIELIKVQ